VTDLSPLGNLDHIEDILIRYSPVSDLTPLSNLKKLKSLNIVDTKICDLGPISRLNSLEELGIWRSPINELSPLSSLRNLKVLYIIDCPVDDATPLANLTNLKYLNLTGTQVAGIPAPLLDSKHLEIHFEPQWRAFDPRQGSDSHNPRPWTIGKRRRWKRIHELRVADIITPQR
jgi:Leucine-rich repeat (LRR) protein